MSGNSRKNNIVFVITGHLGLSLSAQTIDIGNATAGDTIMGSRYGPISMPGDAIIFTELSLVYSLSEDMIEFETLYEWLISTVTSSDHNSISQTGEVIYLDVNNNPYAKFTLYGIRPIDIEMPDFDVNVDDTHELTASFKYDTMKFTNLKTGKVIEYAR